ncbi:MAG: GNAT family N-acetyltransferase [Planctomycetota bacterium]|nr:GNAT family N-acetyltransferase [Planctomycetota bacterium]
MRTRRPVAGDRAALLALRAALWPETPAADHAREIDEVTTFVAEADDGTLLGFAEASLRRDPVPGCTTSPVGYLEGWYVAPASRRAGVGRALVAAVERWAAANGCTEMASDALVDNDLGRAAHAALGFVAQNAVVAYAKRIV